MDELSDLQRLHYASNRYAVLLIFQAMDAAGKDGAIRHVMSGTCLGATSTKNAPWHIVPADDKDNARLIVSEIVVDAFRGLKMAYPKPDAKRVRELKSIRRSLSK